MLRARVKSSDAGLLNPSIATTPFFSGSPRRSQGMAIAALIRPHATLSSLRTTSSSHERQRRSPSFSQPPFSSPSRTPFPPTTPELQGRVLEDSYLHAGSPLLLYPSDQNSGRLSREGWEVGQNIAEVPLQITQSAAPAQGRHLTPAAAARNLSREGWEVSQNAAEVAQQITQSAAVLNSHPTPCVLQMQNVSETEHLMMTSSGVSVVATPRYALIFALHFRFVSVGPNPQN